MKRKKFCSLILIVMIVLSLPSMALWAGEEPPDGSGGIGNTGNIEDGGAAGNEGNDGNDGSEGNDAVESSFSWSYDDTTKVLTISGSGPMPEAATFENKKFPWSSRVPYINAVKTITVSEGITTIAENAFSGFENVEVLNLPTTLETISTYAFQGCVKITNLKLTGVKNENNEDSENRENNNEVKNGITIKTNAFDNCSGLSNIELTNCTVEAGAFNACCSSAAPQAALKFTECKILGQIYGGAIGSRVEKITLNDCNVEFMAFTGGYRLSEDSNYLKSVEISGGTVGESVFIGNTKLESVSLSDVSVGRGSFSNLESLNEITSLSNVSLGTSCFSNCTALKTISITGSSSVGSRVFDGCTGIDTVNIPDGIKLGYSDIFLSKKDDGSYKFPDLAARVKAILADKFSYEAVPSDKELTVSDEWESIKYGDQNGITVDTNQITKSAKWMNEDKTKAEVQLQFSHVGRPGTDFVFLLDYSNSMTSLGCSDDMNSRFYDMQSKVCDVADKLLTTEGYDNRIAIVSFGGAIDEITQTLVDTMPFTNTSSTVSSYIMADDPYYQNTDYSSGLEAAKKIIDERTDTTRTPVIIFISDGMPNVRVEDQKDLAAQIKKQGISIFGVMQSVPRVQETSCISAMKDICTDGLFFMANDTSGFSDAVNSAIGASYGYFKITDEINTDAFTLVADSINKSDETNASYDPDANAITWDLTGIMPYQVYTLNFQLDLNKVNNKYPNGDFFTNSTESAKVFESSDIENAVNAVASPTLTRQIKDKSEKDTSNDRPKLNTEDHYAYIIGYPTDYITGERTTDPAKMAVRPQGNITRAEVATIFFRMLTEESRAHYWSQENDYTDVNEDQWFNAAISTLSEAGINSGYPDGSFRPDNYITRAEFAALIVRFFDIDYEGESLFPDIDGHWAHNYIDQAKSVDLVAGYPDGTFDPDHYITRAEAVTLVNRTLDRHPSKEGLHSDMRVWPDNMDSTAWYYADIQEATNSHEYVMHTGKSAKKSASWTKMLPTTDWAALEKEWSSARSAVSRGEVVSN